MQKPRIDKKTKFYILFCSGILILTALLPLQIKMAINLFSRSKDIKAKITQFQRDNASKEQMQNEKEKIEKQIIPKLAGKIVDPQDIFIVSSYILSTAKENNIEIIETNPQEEKEHSTVEDKQVSYRPIIIEATGSFHDLGLFINALEQGDYFLEVQELSLKQKAGQNAHSIKLAVAALQKE